ncbi:pentapeptide repeat-containing protein [Solitalea koreensis]|uniref:Uncharacterized protein YjbI, contains pentapeptide repeats n=1 Tax=Solitalea koreensis TaxID=543615 RepID=A0A521BA19_9SPHI|nr:pentapeptide repeat-containing protein [Solitalea koreensis]SMO43946.1 Uncharacterized protein YjbI, contains pentapeptide repeats [Solitalea koreensis]
MIHEFKTFNRTDFSQLEILNGQFDSCKFIGYDLSNFKLSGNEYLDCQFDDCNLSLINLTGTGLKNVLFKNCKITGVDFSNCKDLLFGVNFENCKLDFSIFYKKKNKGALFFNCSLIETDFAECDLTDAVFNNCNLENSIFDQTILKNADLRTSYNFIIDPEKNNLKKARFSSGSLGGLLAKYDIRIEL